MSSGTFPVDPWCVREPQLRLDVLADSGAYPRLGAVLPTLTRAMAPGVYDIPRVESRARVLATTTTSIGAYRGAGRPEATAAIERAKSRADACGERRA